MVDYKNDLYTGKRTKVLHVGKKSWKLGFLDVEHKDGSFREEIYVVDDEYGLFLPKIPASLCEDWDTHNFSTVV